MDEYIVNDSSIYQDEGQYSALHKTNGSLKTGQVIKVNTRTETEELVFMVEVFVSGIKIPVPCSRTFRFGGVYNYEEFTYRAFNGQPEDEGTIGDETYKPGDVVLVAFLDGDAREGIIIGGLNHPGRKNKFKDDSIVYASEFNGIETTINIDGEYRQTFKGQPTNLDLLNDTPSGEEIPEAEYDEEVGSSYWEWDKTGSYTLTDNATEKPIKINIDKPGGILNINVGDTSMVIDKNSDTISISNKITDISSETSLSITTKDTNIDSSSSINAKSAAINTEGELSQKGNTKIDGNTEITGDLKNDGMALLAGGANPLVYDIVLTIGTGNLGAPVISSHVFLKTVKTKAT